ncbi:MULTISPECIES: helix-turn-helix domain-containing protein [Weeksellaceae]|jgi:transcriptional regulator with XRE-family HTH domain|uniref:transcriptional regulator n=1 Tax=Weeksellaceae TaxID=2762318 RepID=UPI000483DB5D|nr:MULTISPECIES: transcriptional regulator [Weeksellaceae]KUG10610.1 hypothetical protein AMC91_16485 [Elizabethkingia miricola]
MDNNNYLGKNVKILRESYAIDEKLFAETLGISIEELIHLEHSRNINKKNLETIAKIFNLKIQSIIEFSYENFINDLKERDNRKCSSKCNSGFCCKNETFSIH